MLASMSYILYILQSQTSGRFYVGQTSDLERRIDQHNDPSYKESAYTKRLKGPWVCVYHEGFDTRGEAVMREREIKSKKSRKYILNLIRGWQSPGVGRD